MPISVSSFPGDAITPYESIRDQLQNGDVLSGLAVIRNRKFAQSIDRDKLTELARYAIDHFGYSYDKDEIARIAARILSSKVFFTEKQMEKIASDREFICSEYVARCYEHVGLTVQWNQLGFIAPSDFAADPDFELVAVLKKK